MTTVKRPEEPPTKKRLDKIKTSTKIDTSRPGPMIVIPPLSPCDEERDRAETAIRGHRRVRREQADRRLKVMIAHGWQPKAIEPEEVGTVETE
ncbi:MAG TPA: hypothetical protein VLE46_01675 [Nitrospira sp.]|nr:hypothetical protein [Nitrospira sp.]